jgi:PKHD-type hydroxylase
MILVIPDVLEAASVRHVRERLAAMKFIDGAATAGNAARLVKNNLQADMTTPEYGELNRALLAIIAGNETFKLAAMPHRLTNLRFSRYHDNMAYGAHVDNPLTDDLRSDISFTLFLAEPGEYDGGELVMEESGGDRAFKLKPGHMIIYPSTTLHRVAPVTRGERVAGFGWAQSAVRDAARREVLLELELARRALFDRHGPSREIDVLAKSRANLVRMWSEL